MTDFSDKQKIQAQPFNFKRFLPWLGITVAIIGISVLVLNFKKRQELRSRADIGSATLSLTPATGTFAVNDTIAFDLEVTSSSLPLAGANIEISYDTVYFDIVSSGIEVDTQAFNTLLPPATPYPTSSPIAVHKLAVVHLDSNPAAYRSGAIRIGTVRLKTKAETASTTINFKANQLVALDSRGQADKILGSSPIQGTYAISATAPTVTSPAAVTPTSSPGVSPTGAVTPSPTPIASQQCPANKQFPDADERTPYFAAVTCLASAPYCSIAGYTDGNFGPNDTVTRAQAVVFVTNYHANVLRDWTLVNPATATFSDVPTSHYAFQSIETAYANGFVVGYGGTPPTFGPDDPWLHGLCTDAQNKIILCATPPGQMTRGDFIKALYNYGVANQHLPLCAKQSPCPPAGDVDGDGLVTMDDALLIVKAGVGIITLTPEQQTRAEVTNNGIVNVGDAGFIGQYIKELRTTFPICSAITPPPVDPQPISPPASCAVNGDVDGDGLVEVQDALIIFDSRVGTRVLTPDEQSRADVTNDGTINLTDALFILQYLQGTRNTFPSCTAIPSPTPTGGPTGTPGPGICKADFNNNGEIDISDIMQIIYDIFFGNCAVNRCAADFNGVGGIDAEDIQVVLTELRTGCR